MRRVKVEIDFVWAPTLSSAVDRAFFVLVSRTLCLRHDDLPLRRLGHQDCELQI